MPSPLGEKAFGKSSLLSLMVMRMGSLEKLVCRPLGSVKVAFRMMDLVPAVVKVSSIHSS
jgi:hypothetical protein